MVANRCRDVLGSGNVVFRAPFEDAADVKSDKASMNSGLRAQTMKATLSTPAHGQAPNPKSSSSPPTAPAS